LHFKAANGKITGEGQSLLDTAVPKTLDQNSFETWQLKASGTWGLLQAAFCKRGWANSGIAMKGQGTDVHSFYE